MLVHGIWLSVLSPATIVIAECQNMLNLYWDWIMFRCIYCFPAPFSSCLLKHLDLCHWLCHMAQPS